MAQKSADVRKTSVILFRRMNSAMSSSEGFGFSCKTQQPPFKRGAQTSNVDASNAGDEIKPKRLLVLKDAKSGSHTSRETPECGIITPLGTPVVPEVNVM